MDCIPASCIRLGNTAMIAARSASLIEPQRAISSSERPQPVQRRLLESSVQTLMQGVSIIGKA